MNTQRHVAAGMWGAMWLALLCCLPALPSAAKERLWYKYESPYFVAHSNASKRRTLSILDNLELFRSAAIQVANLTVPDGAPKTQIVIMHDPNAFYDLVGARKIGGIALSNDGLFYMVMPAGRSSTTSQSTMRHEFSHVLLGYQSRQFPQWYNEGFAELLATIRFRNRNKEFVFGEIPEDAEWVDGYGFDWNTLVSDGFEVRDLALNKAQSAYLQSWLLVHYVMLGDNFGHNNELGVYLGLIARGQRSEDAFATAFGMDAESLWKAELRPYTKRMSSIVYDYRPDPSLAKFERMDADPAEVSALFRRLREWIVAARKE